MKKNKINLTELEVQSFVTEVSKKDRNTLQGGAKSLAIACYVGDTGCGGGATCGIAGPCTGTGS